MLKVKKELEKKIADWARKQGFGGSLRFILERPADKKHGHYSSNLALVLSKALAKNPQDIAEDFVGSFNTPDFLEKIEIAGPGFLNFYLSGQAVAELLKEDFNLSSKFSGKKILLEHSSPNLFKPFHIGHLVNNSYGEALSRMLTLAGAKVKTLAFPSDVSPGIAKAVWAIKDLRLKDFSIEDIGKAYAYGSEKYKSDTEVKKQVDELNAKIYNYLYGKVEQDEDIKIYEKGKTLSLDFFIKTLFLLDSQIDDFIFESEAEKEGKKIVFENTPGVFEESEGAYIFRGSKYGLFDNVFVNSAGFGTYLAKDLGLLKIKFSKYDFDKSITITDAEQKEHFALLKKSAELINKTWADKSDFLQHGRMAPSSGKFSSRLGNVPLAEDILSEAKEAVEEKIKESGKGDLKNARYIALAALKYGVLKVSMGKSIVWDKEKALSFEGDSGPYLQYSYARASSVLKKSSLGEEIAKLSDLGTSDNLLGSELVFELLYMDDVFEDAVETLSPHKLANYANKLASAFNAFYANEKIIGSADEQIKLYIVERFTNSMKILLEAMSIRALDEM